jgi:hypothetical protein
MKARRKSLDISIEYQDRADAIQSLKKIILSLEGGNKVYDRICKDYLVCEWQIDYVDHPDYREELINGKWCIVIPSKINNK